MVIFDGTHSYRGMRDAFEEDGNRKFVWSRRGMWRPGGGVSNLTFTSYFDAIIEPGEFAHEADMGLTTQHRDGVTMVDPILFCDEEDLLPREEAERELGHRAGRGQRPDPAGLGERRVHADRHEVRRAPAAGGRPGRDRGGQLAAQEPRTCRCPRASSGSPPTPSPASTARSTSP